MSGVSGAPLPDPATVPTGTLRDAFMVAKGLEARTTERPQALARLLGWLLIWLPEDSGKHALAVDILWCLIPDDEVNDSDHSEPPFVPGTDLFADAGRDPRLLELGHSVHETFVGLFERKDPRQAPSAYSSRDSFEEEPAESTFLLEAPSPSYKRSKAMARVRDGHGCAVTKRFDLKIPDAQMQNVQQRFPDFGHGEFTAMQLCHIIPEGIRSYMSGVDSPTDNYKRQRAPSAAAVLRRYTSIEILETLNGSDVHCLSNIITMSTGLHGPFNALQWCLEPIDGDNAYRIWIPSGRPFSGITDGTLVTFVDRSPRLPPPDPPNPVNTYPLPDRASLQLHALCCRVAHLMGSAESDDGILDDYEEVRQLAKDGSSNVLLAAALARIAVR